LWIWPRLELTQRPLDFCHLDASDYFIFDTAQGLLLFDADGSGEGEAAVIAEIDMEKEDGTINAGDVFVGI
jgi:hypothetical protein